MNFRMMERARLICWGRASASNKHDRWKASARSADLIPTALPGCLRLIRTGKLVHGKVNLRICTPPPSGNSLCVLQVRLLAQLSQL